MAYFACDAIQWNSNHAEVQVSTAYMVSSCCHRGQMGTLLLRELLTLPDTADLGYAVAVSMHSVVKPVSIAV